MYALEFDLEALAYTLFSDFMEAHGYPQSAIFTIWNDIDGSRDIWLQRARMVVEVLDARLVVDLDDDEAD